MWGGGCCGSSANTGSAYDVATNTWRPIPAAPLAPRHAPGVWTGTELIVVGGFADGEAGPFADGAAYNPTTRTWRTIPALPQPVYNASLTWTGTEVYLVGGERYVGDTLVAFARAMAYNPATNQWRRVADMPMTRYRHTAVWTGHQLLVWGGQRPAAKPQAGPTTPPHGVAYDPATDRWAAMPISPLRGRTDMLSVWTGSQLLIWGGYGVTGDTRLADGGTFEPTTS